MREVLLATSYWIHLTASAVWIGGIIFVLFITIPAARQVLGGESGKLMGDISKRFAPLVNYSMISLIVTGIVIAGLNKQLSGYADFGNPWILIIVLKLVVVSGMIGVHFFRGLVLTPRIARTESAAIKTSLQKLSLNLVKVNLALGVLVLLFSGMAAVL